MSKRGKKRKAQEVGSFGEKEKEQRVLKEYHTTGKNLCLMREPAIPGRDPKKG